ncbi:unnamed protein product [Closterium sp. Naga37s-1]|nr:unnamed protein product [Closterium sp. Naga37s-1]
MSPTASEVTWVVEVTKYKDVSKDALSVAMADLETEVSRGNGPITILLVHVMTEVPCSRGMDLPASEVDPKTALEHGRRLVEVMLRPLLAHAKTKKVHCNASIERNDRRELGLCAAARRANAQRVYVGLRKKLLGWSSSASAHYEAGLPPSCLLVVVQAAKQHQSMPGSGGDTPFFVVSPNAFIFCRYNAPTAPASAAPASAALASGSATPDSEHLSAQHPNPHLHPPSLTAPEALAMASAGGVGLRAGEAGAAGHRSSPSLSHVEGAHALLSPQHARSSSARFSPAQLAPDSASPAGPGAVREAWSQGASPMVPRGGLGGAGLGPGMGAGEGGGARLAGTGSHSGGFPAVAMAGAGGACDAPPPLCGGACGGAGSCVEGGGKAVGVGGGEQLRPGVIYSSVEGSGAPPPPAPTALSSCMHPLYAGAPGPLVSAALMLAPRPSPLPSAPAPLAFSPASAPQLSPSILFAPACLGLWHVTCGAWHGMAWDGMAWHGMGQQEDRLASLRAMMPVDASTGHTSLAASALSSMELPTLAADYGPPGVAAAAIAETLALHHHHHHAHHHSLLPSPAPPHLPSAFSGNENDYHRSLSDAARHKPGLPPTRVTGRDAAGGMVGKGGLREAVRSSSASAMPLDTAAAAAAAAAAALAFSTASPASTGRLATPVHAGRDSPGVRRVAFCVAPHGSAAAAGRQGGEGGAQMGEPGAGREVEGNGGAGGGGGAGAGGGGGGMRSLLADELALLDEEEEAGGGGEERWEGKAVSSNRAAEAGADARGNDNKSERFLSQQLRAMQLSGPQSMLSADSPASTLLPTDAAQAGAGGEAVRAVAEMEPPGQVGGAPSNRFSSRFSSSRPAASAAVSSLLPPIAGGFSTGGGSSAQNVGAHSMGQIDLRGLGAGGDGFDCRLFTPKQLEKATRGYARENLLGRGSFGYVFRGEMLGCKVAVKRLEGQGWQGPDEFRMEVDVLSRMRHPNIVLLMGCCLEEMALIYEFLSGGTLQDKLGPPKTPDAVPLSWVDRLRIFSEISSALLYLHQNEPPIVHRDLKPDNILLDGHMMSKIGDVGLARLLCADDVMTMKVRGTAGYIDPEEVETCEISVLSDIYALGLILLQLLTGQRSVKAVHRMLADCTSRPARPGQPRAAAGAEMVLRYLDTAAGDWRLDLAEQVAALALRCAERRRENRPDLAEEIHPTLVRVAAEASAEERRRKKRIDSQFICPISKVRLAVHLPHLQGATRSSSAPSPRCDSQFICPISKVRLAVHLPHLQGATRSSSAPSPRCDSQFICPISKVRLAVRLPHLQGATRSSSAPSPRCDSQFICPISKVRLAVHLPHLQGATRSSSAPSPRCDSQFICPISKVRLAVRLPHLQGATRSSSAPSPRCDSQFICPISKVRLAVRLPHLQGATRSSSAPSPRCDSQFVCPISKVRLAVHLPHLQGATRSSSAPSPRCDSQFICPISKVRLAVHLPHLQGATRSSSAPSPRCDSQFICPISKVRLAVHLPHLQGATRSSSAPSPRCDSQFICPISKVRLAVRLPHLQGATRSSSAPSPRCDSQFVCPISKVRLAVRLPHLQGVTRSSSAPSPRCDSQFVCPISKVRLAVHLPHLQDATRSSSAPSPRCDSQFVCPISKVRLAVRLPHLQGATRSSSAPSPRCDSQFVCPISKVRLAVHLPHLQGATRSSSAPSPRCDSQFICPISKEIMKDPVVAADGFTYERQHITRWMGSSSLSPATGQPLPHTCLTPNNVLKNLIASHKFH